jgi:type I restriction enzyme S subunit
MTLPSGWTAAAVRDLVQFNPKTEVPDETPCGFVPMQGLGTAFLAGLQVQATRPWGDVKKAYTHFRDGDVLVAKVTPCFENGKAGVATALPNGIGAGSSEFCVFRPAEGLESRYLLGWFSTEDFRRRATLVMTGSVGLKRVPKDVFLDELLPLAPAAEQRRIADKLDTVLARVDAVNDRLARVAPLLKRFRQSVLAAAMSGRLTEEWRLDARATDEWTHVDRMLLVKDLVALDLGYAFKSAEYAEEGVRLLRGDNIEPGSLRWRDAKHWPQALVDRTRHIELQAGDIVLAMDRPLVSAGLKIAQVAAEDLPCLLVQRVCRFRAGERLLSGFLFAALRSTAFIDHLMQVQNGSSVPHISGSQILSFRIPVPSYPEQIEIVRRVEILFAYADRLEARLHAAQTAADRLTPALLAKAFRGELVPQDPNDEPASELLERLTASRAAAPKTQRGRAVSKT